MCVAVAVQPVVRGAPWWQDPGCRAQSRGGWVTGCAVWAAGRPWLKNLLQPWLLTHVVESSLLSITIVRWDELLLPIDAVLRVCGQGCVGSSPRSGRKGISVYGFAVPSQPRRNAEAPARCPSDGDAGSPFHVGLVLASSCERTVRQPAPRLARFRLTRSHTRGKAKSQPARRVRSRAGCCSVSAAFEHHAQPGELSGELGAAFRAHSRLVFRH